MYKGAIFEKRMHVRPVTTAKLHTVTIKWTTVILILLKTNIMPLLTENLALTLEKYGVIFVRVRVG